MLPEGSSFTFFGKNYGPGHPGIFVGSNGYITFGQGDTEFGANFEDFCELPRIAALYDDFNPSQGGTVKAEFQSKPDRLVVTWYEVPDFFNTGSNTFQIILFLHSNKYRISYKGVDVTDGIVGVCEGPPHPSDISCKSHHESKWNGCIL